MIPREKAEEALEALVRRWCPNYDPNYDRYLVEEVVETFMDAARVAGGAPPCN